MNDEDAHRNRPLQSKPRLTICAAI